MGFPAEHCGSVTTAEIRSQKKVKKATKILDSFVLIIGVSDSLNSPKVQPVIASSKIYEMSSLV